MAEHSEYRQWILDALEDGDLTWGGLIDAIKYRRCPVDDWDVDRFTNVLQGLLDDGAVAEYRESNRIWMACTLSARQKGQAKP